MDNKFLMIITASVASFILSGSTHAETVNKTVAYKTTRGPPAMYFLA